MSYRELSPPPELARHVACLWVHAADADATHAIVPDACADIISISGAPPVVVGPATRSEHVTLPAGSVIVGARFRPGAVGAALGLTAGELIDRHIPLSDIWRPSSSQLADALAAGEVPARLDALRHALTRSLASRPLDDLALAAVAWLAHRPGAHVASLAAAIGLGERQLRRRIVVASGYAPKRLHRILRFQRLLVETGRPGIAGLAALAASAGSACGPSHRPHRRVSAPRPGPPIAPSRRLPSSSRWRTSQPQPTSCPPRASSSSTPHAPSHGAKASRASSAPTA